VLLIFRLLVDDQAPISFSFRGSNFSVPVNGFSEMYKFWTKVGKSLLFRVDSFSDTFSLFQRLLSERLSRYGRAREKKQRLNMNLQRLFETTGAYSVNPACRVLLPPRVNKVPRSAIAIF